MTHSASLIAYAFVKRGIEEGNPVTQMKLQKLVFFAHGIHLAQYGDPLITEQFQAWKFGPVVPQIYNSYKFYGSSPITDTFWLFSTPEKLNEELLLLDNKSVETIDITWNTLGKYNAAQLSNWTHQVGSPWSKVYNENVRDAEIPNDEIKLYFNKYLVK